MKTKILSCALILTLVLGASGVTTLASVVGDTVANGNYAVGTPAPRGPGQYPMQDFMPENNGWRPFRP